MRQAQVKLLQSLIEIPSPSGFETEIANFIKKECLKVLPRTKVNVDFQNNVVVSIDGKSDRTVIIDAHLDTIGFTVTNIDEDGLISMNYLGGGDNQILSARDLTILTENGNINAVIDRLHSHLIGDEDEVKVNNIFEAQVDIGIRGRGKVKKLVKIGDPIVYKPNFHKLADGYYSGYGFDDKAGCYVIIQTIKDIVKRLGKKKPPVNLVFVFSAQEETSSKLIPVVRDIKPSLVVSLDVTFATDYGYEVGQEWMAQVGQCDLLKGAVIYRGLELHKPTVKLLESTARKHKIKFQTQANCEPGGFTSLMVTDKCHGVKAGVIGLPLRNMHTPVEIINLTDLNNSSKLLTEFLLSSQLLTVLDK